VQLLILFVIVGPSFSDVLFVSATIVEARGLLRGFAERLLYQFVLCTQLLAGLVVVICADRISFGSALEFALHSFRKTFLYDLVFVLGSFLGLLLEFRFDEITRITGRSSPNPEYDAPVALM
jgi:hypothetical protein